MQRVGSSGVARYQVRLKVRRCFLETIVPRGILKLFPPGWLHGCAVLRLNLTLWVRQFSLWLLRLTCVFPRYWTYAIRRVGKRSFSHEAKVSFESCIDGCRCWRGSRTQTADVNLGAKNIFILCGGSTTKDCSCRYCCTKAAWFWCSTCLESRGSRGTDDGLTRRIWRIVVVGDRAALAWRRRSFSVSTGHWFQPTFSMRVGKACIFLTMLICANCRSEFSLYRVPPKQIKESELAVRHHQRHPSLCDLATNPITSIHLRPLCSHWESYLNMVLSTHPPLLSCLVTVCALPCQLQQTLSIGKWTTIKALESNRTEL